MFKEKILIATPVFNEVNVPQIIRRIKEYSSNLLVVDDGSTYNLRSELENMENLQVLVHKENLGYGKAIIDALSFAIRNGYEYLVTIDADGQHKPEEIPLFLREIPFRDYDILSGSRYMLPVDINNNVPNDRYTINREITRMINNITGFKLTDAFCGFKAYKLEKMKYVHLTEYDYGMPLQLWIQAWKNGLQIKEIPVKLIYKDLTKRFKGTLADAQKRLQYYKNIIERELADMEVCTYAKNEEKQQ